MILPAVSFGLLCPVGGRGSYGDIGGPVITTQVTIPKDVSWLNGSAECVSAID